MFASSIDIRCDSIDIMCDYWHLQFFQTSLSWTKVKTVGIYRSTPPSPTCPRHRRTDSRMAFSVSEVTERFLLVPVVQSTLETLWTFNSSAGQDNWRKHLHHKPDSSKRLLTSVPYLQRSPTSLWSKCLNRSLIVAPMDILVRTLVCKPNTMKQHTDTLRQIF